MRTHHHNIAFAKGPSIVKGTLTQKRTLERKAYPFYHKEYVLFTHELVYVVSLKTINILLLTFKVWDRFLMN